MPDSAEPNRGVTTKGSAAVYRWFPLLLVVSGALGLVYEVLWQRAFALLFGSSAPASAAVLAAYFTGLLLGALVLGRVAERVRNPLALYAVLEVVVGVGALLVEPILSLYARIYPGLYETHAGNPWMFGGIKAVLAVGSILGPTMAMGGTIPVLAKLYEAEGKLGRTAGWLYVLNTAGAAVGALAVPFFLLHHLGVQKTTYAAAAMNVVVGVLAYGCSRGTSLAEGMSVEKEKTSKLVLLYSIVSGALTFALQVLWSRAFAQVHENSVYSFALFVCLFIFALAAGGQIARVFLGRGFAPYSLVGWSWMIAGVAMALASFVFVKQTEGLRYLPGASGWMGYAWSIVMLAAKSFLLPVVVMGVAFPALMEVAGAGKRQASIHMGRLLAVNLAGSVGGALLAGFAMPELLGMWRSIGACAATLLVMGGLCGWLTRKSATQLGTGLILAGLVAVGYARSDLPLLRLGKSERITAIKEGAHGIVAVVDSAQSRRIKLNNHYQLGGTISTGDERMQSHIPLLLHEKPERVLYLGYGTGITAGGALFHTNVQVEAVELVAEVVELAPYFAEFTENFGKAPGSRLITEDARNHLRGTRQKYDVIIGDLVVPWRQGEGALYTKEQFEAVRGALNTNGIYCAWLPMFQLSKAEFEVIVRTFFTVFEKASVWRGDFSPHQPAIALIAGVGREAPLPKDASARMGRMRPDASNPHLKNPAALTIHLIGVLSREQSGTGGAINTEDQPVVELLGPLLHSGVSKGNLFIGRPLLEWQQQMGQQMGNVAGSLMEAEIAGWRAGMLMAEFAQAFTEGNRERARALQVEMKGLLPSEVYQALFPGE